MNDEIIIAGVFWNTLDFGSGEVTSASNPDILLLISNNDSNSDPYQVSHSVAIVCLIPSS